MSQNAVPTPKDGPDAAANRTGKKPKATHPVGRRRALRTIAIFEAIKGFTALAASLGFLSLLHHDLHAMAVALIGHFGLNPGDRYPTIVLHNADALADANLRSLVLLATGYIVLRLVEAYGLWFEKVWGEWLGAISGALYVPFEIRHILHHSNAHSFWIGVAVLLGNLFIVGVLVHQLWRNLRGAQRPVDSAPAR